MTVHVMTMHVRKSRIKSELRIHLLIHTGAISESCARNKDFVPEKWMDKKLKWILKKIWNRIFGKFLNLTFFFLVMDGLVVGLGTT